MSNSRKQSPDSPLQEALTNLVQDIEVKKEIASNLEKLSSIVQNLSTRNDLDGLRAVLESIKEVQDDIAFEMKVSNALNDKFLIYIQGNDDRRQEIELLNKKYDNDSLKNQQELDLLKTKLGAKIKMKVLYYIFGAGGLIAMIVELIKFFNTDK